MIDDGDDEQEQEELEEEEEDGEKERFPTGRKGKMVDENGITVGPVRSGKHLPEPWPKKHNLTLTILFHEKEVMYLYFNPLDLFYSNVVYIYIYIYIYIILYTIRTSQTGQSEGKMAIGWICWRRQSPLCRGDESVDE